MDPADYTSLAEGYLNATLMHPNTDAFPRNYRRRNPIAMSESSASNRRSPMPGRSIPSGMEWFRGKFATPFYARFHRVSNAGAHTMDQLLEFNRMSENLEKEKGVDVAIMNSIASVGSVCNAILVYENRTSMVINQTGPPD